MAVRVRLPERSGIIGSGELGVGESGVGELGVGELGVGELGVGDGSIPRRKIGERTFRKDLGEVSRKIA